MRSGSDSSRCTHQQTQEAPVSYRGARCCNRTFGSGGWEGYLFGIVSHTRSVPRRSLADETRTTHRGMSGRYPKCPDVPSRTAMIQRNSYDGQDCAGDLYLAGEAYSVRRPCPAASGAIKGKRLVPREIPTRPA
jgi:hypothetical protein